MLSQIPVLKLTDIYISANFIIPHTHPDDEDRASLQNVGIWLNIDAADSLRKFYNIDRNMFPETLLFT
jgi:hypothetical protein